MSHSKISFIDNYDKVNTSKHQMATIYYIPGCFGVYSTKKLLALFSVTFGIICLPVGPETFHT